jgi:ABC-type phosphate transport system substrate-binding protein
MRRQIVAVATAGTVAVLGLTATAQAQSASQPSRARATTTPAALRGSPVRMSGPHMYDPATGKPFPDASTVTVSQTTQLVNQMVQVSWTNFTPSSATVYGPSDVAYPVMVTECRGTDPSSPADCYGAENGGVTPTAGPFGPMNDAYATTGPNGRGQTDIDILTKTENQALGCDSTHPCSLAVVPAQGGNYSKTPPDCADHSQDFSFGTGYAVGAEAFGAVHFSCSWAKRIVFPLAFDHSAATCPARNPAFTTAGSPMLARAMESWMAALCAGAHGTTINYDGVVAEPQALTELGTGQTDVALTTRTASAQGISTGPKHYVYAPVAVSAVSVAYWFDNSLTGMPVTNIRLNQRLLLKLLTTSYAFDNDGCPSASPGVPCDKGVDHNPLNLFVDPEFLKLNPEYASQNGQPPRVVPPPSSAFEVPTVVLGRSDTTWTATRWIDANKAASQFLAGQFDPYGMHVNTYYLGTKYPANSFVPEDPFPFIAHLYNPVFPSSLVAFDQVENWPPEFSDQKDQFGHYPRLPPQPTGGRSLIAITGQGDAAAFLFPVARISNATGHFVRPNDSGMAAAVRTMIPAGDGTLQVNLHSRNPAVYPLTMVIYAVAPTSGTSHAKAAAIAKFIDYAAGAGQSPGLRPGQLPPGFLPLTAKLRAQARKAAQEVLNQTGAIKP